MKVEIEKKDFLKIADLAAEIIPGKNVHPVLQTFYFNASGDKANIRMTDSEISLLTDIPAKVFEAGECCIPKIMISVVKQFSTSSFTIYKEGNIVNVAELGGEYTCHFPVLEGSEYPLPELSDANSQKIVLSSSILRNMLEKVKPFCDKSGVRHVFHAVFLEVKNGTIMAVASDTKRLGMVKNKIRCQNNFSALIPYKSVLALITMLKDTDEFIELQFQDKKIVFKEGVTVFISPLVEGKFPDARALIPEKDIKEIKIGTQILRREISSLKPFLQGDVQKIFLTFNDDGLILSTEKNELGQGRKKISVKSKYPLNIAFNAVFLSDILSQIDNEETCIIWEALDRPFLFKPAAMDSEYFISVPMAM